ncbi:four helix bundle protein [Flavobacterium sp.]|uniref:four helix bundle protein n=1 Tax=Flavobacterium sp. TaxID=239 RepID=UPI002B4AAE5C|nr:four helix bundle protein [Flavobacterium sp.]HLP64116.1 four helix bundle protein [Flavobacterium sp.]
MRDYKKFTVWEKSHNLTLQIYNATIKYPKEEIFGLISQMKRSSSSIPTNIAEGCGRNSDKDFCRFLYFAYGSANELEYQLLLSIDLKFIENEEGQKLLFQNEEIKKMLNGLITKLHADS